MIVCKKHPLSKDYLNRLKCRIPLAIDNIASFDLCDVVANRCFILQKFDEENPLYIIESGDAYMLLYGQWFFDPHTAEIPEFLFDKWSCEDTFFRSFSIHYISSVGSVLRMTLNQHDFVKTERLSHEIVFKRLSECMIIPRRASFLLDDLREMEIIE